LSPSFFLQNYHSCPVTGQARSRQLSTGAFSSNIEEVSTISGKSIAAVYGHLARKQFDALCLDAAVPDYSPEAIRALRARLNISQTVLASAINTSANSIQKWERGAKRPSGTALKLLSLLDRKGLEVVL
jgi:putative transcriptional regulator